MNISLTPELERFVNEKVESGMYCTASEVIREGLRILKEQDELKTRRLEELRRELSIGIQQLDEGKRIPGEQVFDELRQRSKSRRRKSA